MKVIDGEKRGAKRRYSPSVFSKVSKEQEINGLAVFAISRFDFVAQALFLERRR